MSTTNTMIIGRVLPVDPLCPGHKCPRLILRSRVVTKRNVTTLLVGRMSPLLSPP